MSQKTFAGAALALALIGFGVLLLYAAAPASLSPANLLPIVLRPKLAITPPPPDDMSILPNYTTYVDSINYLHVVGEVSNSTPDYVRFVKITADFFSGSGQLLDTDFTYTWLDNLPPGAKTCFDLSVPYPPEWANLKFEPVTYRSDGRPPAQLSIFNDRGFYVPDFGWYEIVGQVWSDHLSTVEFVSPVGTLYDAGGAVIGCDFTYVNSTDLNAGQASAFEILFTGRDYSDVASYRLQVDGDLQ